MLRYICYAIAAIIIITTGFDFFSYIWNHARIDFVEVMYVVSRAIIAILLIICGLNATKYTDK